MSCSASLDRSSLEGVGGLDMECSSLNSVMSFGAISRFPLAVAAISVLIFFFCKDVKMKCEMFTIW